MVTHSRVHAARTSPIPGLVVIVLAVAAVLFGVAFVRKSSADTAALTEELARLKGDLDQEATVRAKLERRLSDRQVELEDAAQSIAELSRAQRDLRAEVERAVVEATAGPHSAIEREGSRELGPDAAETRAEIEALQRRAMDLESGLEALRPIVLGAGGAPAAANDAAARPLPAEVVTVDAGAPPIEVPDAALAAARAAATEHAALLAPFFDAGVSQPNGGSSASSGPVSYAALVAAGMLAEPTEEALEKNEGLRRLAEFASNTPNDRTLWPYSRGSRARVWYLRGDGRESVPLAAALLREHGPAFVTLGLLAP